MEATLCGVLACSQCPFEGSDCEPRIAAALLHLVPCEEARALPLIPEHVLVSDVL